jgi:hypothetical protein
MLSNMNNQEWQFAKYPLHFSCYAGLDFISANYDKHIMKNFGWKPEHTKASILSYQFRKEDLDRVEATAMDELLPYNQRVSNELERAKSLHSWDGASLQGVSLTFIEEAGEVIQAVNNFKEGKGNKEQIKTELIQTAAMCFRMLEFLDNQ